MEIQLVYIVEGYKFKEYKNAANFEEFIKNKNFMHHLRSLLCIKHIHLSTVYKDI